MRAVLQRVKKAAVKVEDKITGEIKKGLLILLGIEQGDNDGDLDYMVKKCCNLRIFTDENDKMNLSVLDIGGSLLVVSQFTLLGDCKKGLRPSFIKAAHPDEGNKYYRMFIEKAKLNGYHVKEGVFGVHMDVELVNDGPVTIIIDSRKQF